jgi:sugar phosphate isomerase/epimerase
MKIGISIAYDYFIDAPRSEAALILKEHIGDYRKFLSYLQDMGVASIELRGLEWNIDKDTVEKIFRKLWESGFSISIHSSLPEKECVNPHSYLLFLKEILPQIHSFQKNLIIVLHSHRDSNSSYDELLNQSANAINSIAAYLDRGNLPLKLAIELNRGKKEQDPSVTYEGLLKLYSMIECNSNVGFCWDFGHAYSNFSNGIISLEASEKFVSRVIHTHIHGVSKDDKTHCILSPDNLPLNDYLKQLKTAGYEGIFNLEINPQRMIEKKDILPALENSINCLLKALGSIRKPEDPA